MKKDLGQLMIRKNYLLHRPKSKYKRVDLLAYWPVRPRQKSFQGLEMMCQDLLENVLGLWGSHGWSQHFKHFLKFFKIFLYF